jgi:hypothetical protein
MDNYLAEGAIIKSGILPQSNLGALTGERINMGKSDRVAVVITLGATAGATVDITLQQHNAASGGTSKALSVDNNYYHKITAASVFTKVEPVSAASNYVLTGIFGGTSGVVVFEVSSSQLDVNGGFNFFSVNLAAATVAKIVSVEYIGHQPYKGSAHLEAI